MTARVVAALLLTVLAGHASADDGEEPFNMLAVDTSFGLHARSLGMSVEHPVFTRVRVVAAYDWLWTDNEDGHRASLGVRRELWGHGNYHSRTFIDGELGASLALLSRSEPMAGVDLIGAGYAGVRVGYDLYSDRDESPSRTFELALTCRVIESDGGTGITVGVSTAWGN